MSKYGIGLTDSRDTKIKKIQEGTIRDIEINLEKYNKALVVRPTEFTRHILKELSKSRKVLCIYTSENIVDTKTDIEFYNYADMIEDMNTPCKLIDIVKDEIGLSEDINKYSENMPKELKAKLIKLWWRARLKDIELVVIIDIHKIKNKQHIEYLKGIEVSLLGITNKSLNATTDRDIIDLFSYKIGNTLKDTAITPLTIKDLLDYEIVKRPYYVKALLNRQTAYEDIITTLDSHIKSHKTLNHTDTNTIYNRCRSLTGSIDTLVNTVSHIYSHNKNNKEHMKFVVYYENNRELIDKHREINNSLQIALPNHSLKSHYITENTSELSLNNIHTSILDKVRDIKNEPNRLDIIHTTDTLRIEGLTGIVIVNHTHLYYEQLESSISLSTHIQPLIIDIQGIDSLLGVHKENTAEQFISMCEHSKQNKSIDKLSKYIQVFIDTDSLSDELLRYLYFDRNAPIYYIWFISKSLGKPYTIEEITQRVYNACKKVNRHNEFMRDTEAYSTNQLKHLRKQIRLIIDKEVVQRS